MYSKLKTYLNSSNFSNVVIPLIFGYFLIKIFYFAFLLSHSIPPDETTHLSIIKVYSQVGLIPKNTAATASLGLVADSPFLYYWLMGKLIHLNFFTPSDLIFLRVINCILAFITTLYAVKWIKLVTNNNLVHILFAVLLTNTVMYTIIGGAVTYDNLTNLFAASALFYLTAYLRSKRSRDLLLWAVCLLAGTITKVSYIPLGVAFIIVLLFRERKCLTTFLGIPGKALSERHVADLVMVLFVVVLFLLNCQLYGGNLIKYGRFTPNLDQVFTVEEAMQNRIFARDRILLLYSTGKINYDQALKMADKITHQGDRAGTKRMLEVERYYQEKPFYILNPVQYIWTWLELMVVKINHVETHRYIIKTENENVYYNLFFLLSAIFFIRYYQKDDEQGLLTLSLIVFIFYTLVLIYWVCYPIYISSHYLGKDQNARYWMPVIFPFYALISYYLLKPLKFPYNFILIIIVAFLFINGEFPYFLRHDSAAWYGH